MERLVLVAGARPNFMKLMPICRELDNNNRSYTIFNSMQHYDANLNSIFIEQFGIKNIISISSNKVNKVKQIQDIIFKFNKFLSSISGTTEVIVVGDVDTSCFCALAASRLRIPVLHIESGLRSFDITMPEERNRITIDHLSYFNFAHSKDSIENLANEGIVSGVENVGNIMIDTLCILKDKIQETKAQYKKDIIVTFHRPENVDNIDSILNILNQLALLAERYSILFPVHPRTKKSWPELFNNYSTITFIDPLGYLEFMSEVNCCKAVITDSGGIQEETSYLGIPCFTVRQSTERPITIELGTNKLIEIMDIGSIEVGPRIVTNIPLWDGHTSERICKLI